MKETSKNNETTQLGISDVMKVFNFLIPIVEPINIEEVF